MPPRGEVDPLHILKPLHLGEVHYVLIAPVYVLFGQANDGPLEIDIISGRQLLLKSHSLFQEWSYPAVDPEAVAVRIKHPGQDL